jgi:hypothetical protein
MRYHPHDETWTTVETQPGYFGKKRAERHAEYDTQHGRGRWRIAWQVGPHIMTFEQFVQLYEDAYFQFLLRNPRILNQLVEEASEVYDTALSNIESGLDYLAQEDSATHLQDITIRRSLMRLGRWFEGKEPLQVRHQRGGHALSMILSPGCVPFHLPELLPKSELTGWWAIATVEDMYQKAKIIQVLA